jgi:cellulose synthase/poly-beta-1,6-N-acetylglucosamine synthase-like glycosyltransferase
MNYLLNGQNSLEILGYFVFAIGFAGIVYTYAGYPLFINLISIYRNKKRPTPSTEFSISIIISAHNEASSIRKKLVNTLELNYPREKIQIIVVSDGSSDTTDEIVHEFFQFGVELIRVFPRQGKTHAQNIAVSHAKHALLIFSDATTQYDPNALQYIAGNYRDENIGAVSGKYEYYDKSQASPTASGSIRFWNYENWIKRNQSDIRTITGCCGCIYSVRKDLYTVLPADVISDLVQPLHVIMQGFNVAFEDRALAWEATTTRSSEEFKMRVRVITRGMHGLLTVPGLLIPWRNTWIAFQLWSHKILRWMVPVFLLLVLVGSFLLSFIPVFRALLFMQIMFYSVALFSALVPSRTRRAFRGIFFLPLYFCLVNAASLLSMVHLMCGKKFTIWQPVRR